MLTMCASESGMRFHIKCFSLAYVLLLAALPSKAASELRFSFHVMGDDPGGWPELLSSIGLTGGTGGGASVIVVPRGADLPPAEWASLVERGVILVLEGESPLAAAFGFHAGTQPHVSAR